VLYAGVEKVEDYEAIASEVQDCELATNECRPLVEMKGAILSPVEVEGGISSSTARRR